MKLSRFFDWPEPRPDGSKQLMTAETITAGGSALDSMRASPGVAPVSLQRAGRWLVVDDTGIHRTLIGAILEAHAATVDFGTDGFEALDAIERATYVAMIIDGNMPNLDGFETIKRVREREAKENLERLPIILWTGKPHDERISEADHDSMLSKPMKSLVKIVEIASILGFVLQRQDARSAL